MILFHFHGNRLTFTYGISVIGRSLSRSVAKKSTTGRPQEVTVSFLPSDRKENVGKLVVSVKISACNSVVIFFKLSPVILPLILLFFSFFGNCHYLIFFFWYFGNHFRKQALFFLYFSVIHCQ